MTDENRVYRKTRRAESEQETKRRIAESAVELHGTLGPSQTSISAVALHSGVRRSTVYRHYPTEEDLFAACTALWNAGNPLPDLTRWAEIHEPPDRLARALPELYAVYRRNEQMISNLLRDEPTMPLVQKSFGPFHAYLHEAARVLRVGAPGTKLVRAAIGHATAFTAWQSLTRDQGLTDRQAVDLMCGLVAATYP